MAKQLAALLGGVDIQRLAELVRQHGRSKDTVLAHITPREAEMLKANGGSGTINPMTGLPEFQESYWQTPVDPQGYYPPNMPVETSSGNALVEGEYSMEPPGNTYFTTPYAPMPNYAQSSEPYFMGEQMAQSFEPALTRSFAPQDIKVPGGFGFGGTEPEFGLGMYGEQTQAPQQREFSDLLKQGAKQVLGTREGLAGAGTLAAVLQARQAGRQAQRMQREIAAIGAPQRALGQEMMRLGQAGQVTPVQRQQLEALAARERQQLAQRGLTSGTAAQQAQAQAVMREQRAAQDLLDQGLKVAGIGDQYQAAAIKAGYAADQATRDMLNTTLTNLYRTIYGNVQTPVTTSTTQTPPGGG